MMSLTTRGKKSIYFPKKERQIHCFSVLNIEPQGGKGRESTPLRDFPFCFVYLRRPYALLVWKGARVVTIELLVRGLAGRMASQGRTRFCC